MAQVRWNASTISAAVRGWVSSSSQPAYSRDNPGTVVLATRNMLRMAGSPSPSTSWNQYVREPAMWLASCQIAI